LLALQYHKRILKKPLSDQGTFRLGIFKISDQGHFENYYFNDPEKLLLRTFIAPKTLGFVVKIWKHVDENKVFGSIVIPVIIRRWDCIFFWVWFFFLKKTLACGSAICGKMIVQKLNIRVFSRT